MSNRRVVTAPGDATVRIVGGFAEEISLPQLMREIAYRTLGVDPSHTENQLDQVVASDDARILLCGQKIEKVGSAVGFIAASGTVVHFGQQPHVEQDWFLVDEVALRPHLTYLPLPTITVILNYDSETHEWTFDITLTPGVNDVSRRQSLYEAIRNLMDPSSYQDDPNPSTPQSPLALPEWALDIYRDNIDPTVQL